MDISVVIPARNAARFLPDLLAQIERQTLAPREVVIVDSATEEGSEEIVRGWQGRVPLRYHRVDFAYPGVARNIGVSLARHEWVAFLDCRTIPRDGWLASCAAAAARDDAAFVWGLFESVADNRFQETLMAATYGRSGVRSLPGSLVRRDLFASAGYFLEVRAGEDIEWISRLSAHGVRMTVVDTPVLSYDGFPSTLGAAIRKWYTYTISNAHIDVLNIQKVTYGSLVVGVAVLFIYRWNELFANWQEDSFWYVPNISKIFVLLLVVSYALYRGMIRPLRRGIALPFLLPQRWLEVFFVSLCLDVAKAPGLLLGAHFLLWKKVLRKGCTCPDKTVR